MAIDLNNAEAKQGAMDALNILIQSKRGPIEIYVGPGQSGQGGLIPPKNVKLKQVDDEGNELPEDPDEANDSEGKEANVEKDTPKDKDPLGLKDPDKNAETLKGIKDDKDYKQEKAEEAEKDAWAKLTAKAKLGNFDEFRQDLYDAIANQVRESKQTEDSYARGISATYAGSDALMPKDLPMERREKPVIYVFFDQSGSFGQDLVDLGNSALASLKEFVDHGDIAEPKLYFFANNLYTEPEKARAEGGTHGWPQCMACIEKAMDLPANERCNNVIVLSDYDIQGQTDYSRPYSLQHKRSWNEKLAVDGCVWWLWGGGSKAEKATEYLEGLSGNFQYKF